MFEKNIPGLRQLVFASWRTTASTATLKTNYLEILEKDG